MVGTVGNKSMRLRPLRHRYKGLLRGLFLFVRRQIRVLDNCAGCLSMIQDAMNRSDYLTMLADLRLAYWKLLGNPSYYSLCFTLIGVIDFACEHKGCRPVE